MLIQDMNREIVTTSLAKLIACISIDGLMTIALIVLFNLCNDFGRLVHPNSFEYLIAYST